MQRWEKQKKAARDLVRARTWANGVTRNETENGTTTLAGVLHVTDRESDQMVRALSHLCMRHLSHLSRLSRDSEARRPHATALRHAPRATAPSRQG